MASISPTSAVAVGSRSPDTQKQETQRQPLALRWDGTRWTPMPTVGLGTGSILTAVTAGPAGVWAAG